MRTKKMLSQLRDGLGIAFVAGLMAGLAAPALAGTFYSWTTEDGVRAYTDDARRVPARYRGTVQLRDTGSLDGYERFTPIVSGAGTSEPTVAARSVERPIASLPAVSAAPPRRGTGGTSVTIDTGEVEIGLVGDQSGEPMVVEKLRVKPEGSDATRTVQVIRQGGRVVAIIKPQPNQQSLGDIQDESKLLD